MSRVLLVGKAPPARAGIGVFLGQLQAGLADRHEIRLENLHRDRLAEGGRLTSRNLARTLADAAAVWRSARGSEIVHVHSALAPLVTLARAGMLAAAGRRAGARTIVHAHGGRLQLWLTTPARRRLARAILRPADRVVAVSEGGRRALAEALGPGRVFLIDNGVDVDAFAPPDGSNEPPRILFVGVLTPRKGLLDLFAASDLLAARGVLHDVWVAGGSPPEGGSSEERVRGAAGPRVHFLGVREADEMPTLYGSVDLFCLPSWWEAMPLSLLEAMASGLPVVATSVGDIPRAVEDGVNGALVPPHAPEALADALERLLRDVEGRRAMGGAGRDRVAERFALRRTLERTDRLYREMTPAPSGTAHRDERRMGWP